jgi:hypothetical protein
MQTNGFDHRHALIRSGHDRRQGRRGAILPLVGVALTALMSLMVLVIDIGALQRQKRMAQAAADAGARAGANELYRQRPAAEIEPAVKRETARNGFTDGGEVTVTVTYPTTSVNAPGSNFVRVVVQRTVGTQLGSFFGVASATIRAEAVGGVGSSNAACLTITEPTEADALSVKSGTLTTVGCGIFVNSTSPNAVSIPAMGEIDAASLGVVGGPAEEPRGVTGPYSSGAPLPPYGADPMAYLTMPAVGACNDPTYGAYSDFQGTTLSPGVYCGGIGIDHGGTVTLEPGLYILAGGGLYLKSGTLIGNGVTFVNTNAPEANGGAANFGVPDALASEPNTAIEIEVNTVIQISAMTTGPLAGVLFYGDPAAGVPGTLYTNYLRSSSANSLMGSMYFPTQGIAAKSNSDLTINGAVVVRKLSITTGQEDITINGPSSGSSYYGLKMPTIVE